jgi:hypothetical protein
MEEEKDGWKSSVWCGEPWTIVMKSKKLHSCFSAADLISVSPGEL